ncbi:uncharacterized protein LOC115924165 [Strongylocentrotus purpuratus]|uniref:Uncharacterized protein n=1 Tax=Strongylocentrotus purpuratus TaxID=7668 RepID=A0A7M7NUU8_STRPU|nr:uncharacterized protein LOC115924165 [Strongylocentrotus purpuratus]
MQVQTVKLDGLQCLTPASLPLLVEALCSMPNLTYLTLGELLHEEFYSTLKAKASSIQGCFPQIRKGNFRLNDVTQDDLNSFLHNLSRYVSTYHATMSSSAPSPNPPVSRHHQPAMSAGYLSPTQYPQPVPESTVQAVLVETTLNSSPWPT